MLYCIIAWACGISLFSRKHQWYCKRYAQTWTVMNQRKSPFCTEKKAQKANQDNTRLVSSMFPACWPKPQLEELTKWILIFHHPTPTLTHKPGGKASCHPGMQSRPSMTGWAAEEEPPLLCRVHKASRACPSSHSESPVLSFLFPPQVWPLTSSSCTWWPCGTAMLPGESASLTSCAACCAFKPWPVSLGAGAWGRAGDVAAGSLHGSLQSQTEGSGRRQGTCC